MSETFAHGYALVVGVDDNNIQRLALPTVAKDVQAVYDVLIHPERCGYVADNVKLLHGVQSTQENIWQALEWLQRKVSADPEATAIIYYSGHGMVDKATSKYYLIPYDISSLNKVRKSAIPAEEFNTEITLMTPQRLLVILDCCHADGMDVKDIDVDFEAQLDKVASKSFPLQLAGTKDVPTLEDPEAKDVSLLAEGNGRAILNSSTGAESSYVRPDRAMSVFTYHLIEALTGHAPQEDGDTVVDVAEVMSYVTRHVKKTVADLGKAQTPVMRTTGVFPVALLLGGEGFAKGVTEIPDPLEPLSEAARALQVTVSDGGAAAVGAGATAVGAGGVNVGGNVGGNIVTGDGNQITETHEGGVNFSGGGSVSIDGSVAGRDLHQGDVVHGDKVGGDKVGGDKITMGDVSGTGIAIGRGASANVTQGLSADELNKLFAPMMVKVAQQAPTAMDKVQALKTEAGRGEKADDNKMAGLIQDIAEAAPSAVEGIVGLFINGALGKVAGGATKFVLGRLGK